MGGDGFIDHTQNEAPQAEGTSQAAKLHANDPTMPKPRLLGEMVHFKG
jgi:hypothetical protein